MVAARWELSEIKGLDVTSPKERMLTSPNRRGRILGNGLIDPSAVSGFEAIDGMTVP